MPYRDKLKRWSDEIKSFDTTKDWILFAVPVILLPNICATKSFQDRSRLFDKSPTMQIIKSCPSQN